MLTKNYYISSVLTLTTLLIITYIAEADLSTVVSEILDVKAKYYQLGISLGLRPGEMDAITRGTVGDVDLAFQRVILKWLQQEYDVNKHGKPS